MKLKLLLSEAATNSVRLAFSKWLKLNNIEHKIVSGGKGKDSYYYEVTFDNGTDFPEVLKIRFSNHSAGFRPVDLDTFKDDINTIDDIFKKLNIEFGLVIKNKKYLGQEWQNDFDLTTHTYSKKPMKIQRD